MKSAPYRDGWKAHAGKVPSGENPYSERSQEYSHSEWISGWCDRHSRVKHELDLGSDDGSGDFE